nr:hypothetical protein BaRGS_007960 [Batillaria attramentaria]
MRADNSYALSLKGRGDWEFRYNSYKNEYTNCTYVLGNLEVIFLDKSGAVFDLSFLSSIREVTGYVLIVGVHADFIPLTNLRVIRGETLFHYPETGGRYSLFLARNFDPRNTGIGLKELRFTSLSVIHCDPSCDGWCYGYLLEDSGVCVQACPDGKFAKDGKHCDPCDQNGVCRKTCTGTNGSDFLNAKNLHQFINCTIIDGTLRILKQSFLDEILETIKDMPGVDIRSSLIAERDRDENGKLTHWKTGRRCTGPVTTTGPGGCDQCHIAVRKQATRSVTCLPPDTDRSLSDQGQSQDLR